MTHFTFEDDCGKICSIFDLKLLETVYPHWDFSQPPNDLLNLISLEIQEVAKNHNTFKESEFNDSNTKEFLVNQSLNVLVYLKRLTNFLEEGSRKGYKLILQ